MMTPEEFGRLEVLIPAEVYGYATNRIHDSTDDEAECRSLLVAVAKRMLEGIEHSLHAARLAQELCPRCRYRNVAQENLGKGGEA